MSVDFRFSTLSVLQIQNDPANCPLMFCCLSQSLEDEQLGEFFNVMTTSGRAVIGASCTGVFVVICFLQTAER